MSNQVEKIRQSIQYLSDNDKEIWIKSLSKDELTYLQMHPEIFIKDYQVIPDGNWRYYWFRGCRGAGKTFSSMAWLASKALNGAKEVAIVGPNHVVLKKEIIPTFINHLPPKFVKSFDKEAGIMVLKNGCYVKLYSSEYEIRGCNAEYAVAEEMAKWCQQQPEKIEECWYTFNLGVRSTRIPNPQILIASTPKPYPFFINFEQQCLKHNERYAQHIVTIDNIHHFSPNQKQAVIEDTPLSLRGQELYCEIVTNAAGAAFSREMIEQSHICNDLPDVSNRLKVVISVDPAVTTGPNADETGIIVACLAQVMQDATNKPMRLVCILEDASGKYSSNQWANVVNNLYYKYQADSIVVEKNNGGELLRDVIHTVNPILPVHLVHASKGKIPHAHPVASLYERQLVKHCVDLRKLEQQMCSYVPGEDSPDRMDALVWAVYELGIVPQPQKRYLDNLPKFA